MAKRQLKRALPGLSPGTDAKALLDTVKRIQSLSRRPMYVNERNELAGAWKNMRKWADHEVTGADEDLDALRNMVAELLPGATRLRDIYPVVACKYYSHARLAGAEVYARQVLLAALNEVDERPLAQLLFQTIDVYNIDFDNVGALRKAYSDLAPDGALHVIKRKLHYNRSVDAMLKCLQDYRDVTDDFLDKDDGLLEVICDKDNDYNALCVGALGLPELRVDKGNVDVDVDVVSRDWDVFKARIALRYINHTHRVEEFQDEVKLLFDHAPDVATECVCQNGQHVVRLTDFMCNFWAHVIDYDAAQALQVVRHAPLHVLEDYAEDICRANEMVVGGNRKALMTLVANNKIAPERIRTLIPNLMQLGADVAGIVLHLQRQEFVTAPYADWAETLLQWDHPSDVLILDATDWIKTPLCYDLFVDIIQTASTDRPPTHRLAQLPLNVVIDLLHLHTKEELDHVLEEAPLYDNDFVKTVAGYMDTQLMKEALALDAITQEFFDKALRKLGQQALRTWKAKPLIEYFADDYGFDAAVNHALDATSYLPLVAHVQKWPRDFFRALLCMVKKGEHRCVQDVAGLCRGVAKTMADFRVAEDPVDDHVTALMLLLPGYVSDQRAARFVEDHRDHRAMARQLLGPHRMRNMENRMDTLQNLDAMGGTFTNDVRTMDVSQLLKFISWSEDDLKHALCGEETIEEMSQEQYDRSKFLQREPWDFRSTDPAERIRTAILRTDDYAETVEHAARQYIEDCVEACANREGIDRDAAQQLYERDPLPFLREYDCEADAQALKHHRVRVDGAEGEVGNAIYVDGKGWCCTLRLVVDGVPRSPPRAAGRAPLHCAVGPGHRGRPGRPGHRGQPGHRGHRVGQLHRVCEAGPAVQEGREGLHCARHRAVQRGVLGGCAAVRRVRQV